MVKLTHSNFNSTQINFEVVSIHSRLYAIALQGGLDHLGTPELSLNKSWAQLDSCICGVFQVFW